MKYSIYGKWLVWRYSCKMRQDVIYHNEEKHVLTAVFIVHDPCLFWSLHSF